VRDSGQFVRYGLDAAAGSFFQLIFPAAALFF
jgi:hypothetical protein